MKNNFFIIGDIHGRLDMLEVLLTQWKKEEQLVFLGDYIDRGPQSKQVLERVRDLKETEGAILLKGNHEDLLLNFLEGPENMANLYLPQGGFQTLGSYFGEEEVWRRRPEIIAQRFKDEQADILKLLQDMASYYETDTHVFVHAGVDLRLKEWKKSKPTDFYWMREPFFSLPNNTGLKFVFGHTPTRNLHPDRRNDVWVSNDGTRIGIDGAAVFDGQLHGLRLGDDMRVSSVTQDLEVLDGTLETIGM